MREDLHTPCVAAALLERNAHQWPQLVVLRAQGVTADTGGTTLLNEAHRPAERAKAQAAHDFLMMTATAIGAYAITRPAAQQESS